MYLCNSGNSRVSVVTQMDTFHRLFDCPVQLTITWWQHLVMYVHSDIVWWCVLFITHFLVCCLSEMAFILLRSRLPSWTDYSVAISVFSCFSLAMNSLLFISFSHGWVTLDIPYGWLSFSWCPESCNNGWLSLANTL